MVAFVYRLTEKEKGRESWNNDASAAVASHLEKMHRFFLTLTCVREIRWVLPSSHQPVAPVLSVPHINWFRRVQDEVQEFIEQLRWVAVRL